MENKFLDKYPELKLYMTPIKELSAPFQKYNENTITKITENIMKKYSSNNNLSNSEVSHLMSDAYKTLQINKKIENIEVKDFIKTHSSLTENSISYNDLKNAVRKHIGSTTGQDITKESEVSHKNKLVNILLSSTNESSEIERIAIEIYAKYNKNKNGYLDKSEMRRMVEDFYYENNIKIDNINEYLDRFIFNCDIDSNGKLSFQEFCDYLLNLRKGIINDNSSNSVDILLLKKMAKE